MMPKLTPPQLILIGIMSGVIITYVAHVQFEKALNQYAHEVQMTTLYEIRRQCNSKYPLLLDSEFYTCKKLPYNLR